MLRKRLTGSKIVSCFLCSLILLVALIAMPVIACGSTVEDCFKTVSGYNAFSNTGPDGIKAAKFAINHPSCVPEVVSLDPYFYGLSAAMIAAKEAGIFKSEGQCSSAITGPAKKAIAGFLKASLGGVLPSSALATLQSIADGKSQEALNSIPVLGQILEELPCACSVAYSGLSVTQLSELISKEAKGIKACGSLLSGAVSTMKEGVEKAGEAVGLSCEHHKINEVEYYQQYLAPILDKYALATENERHAGCYNYPTGACRAACINYYTSGSPGCRMKGGNASHLCDIIMVQFDAKVMARQPVLVAQALASCSGVGDGCVMNKDYPKMVIDTYGQDTLSICLKVLKNTYKTASCKPNEQPCCWRAPWPPELKCKKAREQTPSKVGNLASQIDQSLKNFTTGNADAKMIADLKACHAGIVAKTIQYVSDAACEAAKKAPTDDFSYIWPGVLQEAKQKACGEAYTKCDSPYYKQVKINNCNNTCSSAATLKAVYGKSDQSAKYQCVNDCLSGALAGKVKDPGYQQAQAQQQASCVSQCQLMCQNAPTSVPCQDCKKPNYCGPGASGSGSGTGSGGTGKAKPGSGSGPLQ